MARPRDSRSPAPAGSQDGSRRHRKHDDRRDRDRRDDVRDNRRPSRSRSPDHQHRDRGGHGRDRVHDRDRDLIRRRERSPARRDDGYYRGSPRDPRDYRDNRERRRSRDRYAARPRSPDRRRNRSRDSNTSYKSRDDPRDRAPSRREGTADSSARSSNQKATPGEAARARPDEGQKAKANAPQSDADKKAERLAKLEAWKKKKETESQKQQAKTPGEMTQAIRLLAEMDKKASMASPSSASPVASSVTSPATVNDSGVASPSQPYAGKFDPKSIAKKSAAARSHDSSKPVLGSLSVQPGQIAPPPTKQADTTSALPANRGKASGFGLGKAQAESDKLPNKRKIDLDEEDTSQRKLTKLPALLVEADDTPWADQDEDFDSGDNIAEDEEEAVAAARAAHERRLQAENQADQADDEVTAEANAQPDQQMSGDPVTNGEPAKAEPSEQATLPGPMDVDEDEEDPLDAYMADLEQTESKRRSFQPGRTSKGVQEPETYFSDDDNVFDAEGDGNTDNILAMANKRKKKDIPTTDYNKIYLQPVRKNFWSEPTELSALSEAEVTELRLELDDIKVKGKDVPTPVQKWSQCGLTRQTLDVISGLGYDQPTSIQMQAIPALMSGRDVVGVAKTGSGKTIAFLLPMFRHIMDQPALKDMDGPIGLIMTPTRELATQIHRDCKPFLKIMGLRAVCAYGGAPVRDQIADLKRGAEIIVCTPGRMIDLLAANQGRVTNLKRVTYVVLDEADRMFDMGFEPQVMKIFANMRPDKQTILFSATMPRLIDSLTKKVLKNPVEITVGGRSVVAKEIEQIVEVRDEDTKFLRMLGLLGELYHQTDDARSLVFVERQEKADGLMKELLLKGYPCMSIHGGKDQVDRDSTISDFKKGVIPVLIATSVAARGLDVKQLMLVINYDAPNHMEDYVHRAGRTGRAGNTGVAVTFVTPEQENCAPGIAKALEQSGQPVPEKLDEMRKAHREKVKSGKAKDTSGFGGKGLDRLDQEREAARQLQRRTHRAEGEEDDDKEEKKEDQKGEKALDAIKAAVSAVQARDSPKIEGGEAKPAQKASEAPATGDKSKDPLDKVSSAVSAINSRLGKSGQLRSGQPIDNNGPDAGAYHATLEINDFPQKARWAVTNRTNVAKILDSTGTSITTKGTFYPACKEVPPNGDAKLYILIEGDTEVAVSSALTEMTRLLREATIAAADADSRAPASGRYTVT
ncbi:Pre-mRNA-processing ATP-dependent RNA helicase PRP5 [Tolypocladium ophioglossoides CBS 100239]|uniref:RNA helicase n=1 Tax=Tolypocladium ophioglossoides (strain CBS 100239) TaxID=1163406 RepID=A0A0L0N607_TOLOC|nr:Pre-mRNA-processing ATP-dependent RNA helicase PRP5 [Tolypocladium ophioglossoides CBS 100239]